jgi:hypothetical protein
VNVVETCVYGKYEFRCECDDNYFGDFCEICKYGCVLTDSNIIGYEQLFFGLPTQTLMDVQWLRVKMEEIAHLQPIVLAISRFGVRMVMEKLFSSIAADVVPTISVKTVNLARRAQDQTSLSHKLSLHNQVFNAHCAQTVLISCTAPS